MSDLTNAAWLWAAKGGGALAGSAISLAYMLPQGRREAALRLAVGLVSGMVFGAPTGLKIAALLGIGTQLAPMEMLLMGSASASLAAWWALGFGLRFIERALGGEVRSHGR